MSVFFFFLVQLVKLFRAYLELGMKMRANNKHPHPLSALIYYPLSAYVDADVDNKNQYSQMQMRIAVLGYADADIIRIHIPLYI